MHILVMVIATESISTILLDNLPASIVEHALVAGLLHSSAFVVVQLLSVHYSVSSTNCPVGLCLVHLADLLAIGIHLGLLLDGLLHELAFTELVWPRHVHHASPHVSPHVLKHLVSSLEHITSEPFGEERIILEGVSAHERASESFHHLLLHLVHVGEHVLLSVHHLRVDVLNRHFAEPGCNLTVVLGLRPPTIFLKHLKQFIIFLEPSPAQ